VTPTVYGGQLAVTAWRWLGKHHASNATKRDGSAATHNSLLNLGLALALHAERLKKPLEKAELEDALDAWANEYKRQGQVLTLPLEEYRDELEQSIAGAKKAHWFNRVARFWSQWIEHPEFPKEGTPEDRLLFAIRQNCKTSGKAEFYLGARDAALVAGLGYRTAARLLLKLVADKRLLKLTKTRLPHHAYEYRLLNP
jgi:hypothetical protein